MGMKYGHSRAEKFKLVSLENPFPELHIGISRCSSEVCQFY
jgi:hypothetical protein